MRAFVWYKEEKGKYKIVVSWNGRVWTNKATKIYKYGEQLNQSKLRLDTLEGRGWYTMYINHHMATKHPDYKCILCKSFKNLNYLQYEMFTKDKVCSGYYRDFIIAIKTIKQEESRLQAEKDWRHKHKQ